MLLLSALSSQIGRGWRLFCFDSFIYNPLHTYGARRAMAATVPLPSRGDGGLFYLTFSYPGPSCTVIVGRPRLLLVVWVVLWRMVNFWCSKIDFKIIEGFLNWWDGGETMGWWWCVGGWGGGEFFVCSKIDFWVGLQALWGDAIEC